MNVKAIVGADTYERMRDVLAGIHPDEAHVEDPKVDAFIVELWRNYQPQFRACGLEPPPPDLPPAAVANAPAAGHRTYMAHATHARLVAPFSSFTGHLPMVRVALPAETASNTVIGTEIGNVDFDQDHLLRSRADVVKFGVNEGFDLAAERIELVTPARQTDDRRFAAISFFLGYRAAAGAVPDYYILEAGLAGGGPRVLYPSDNMGTLQYKSGYRPTPFASPNHWYTGKLTMTGDEPNHLHVDVSTARNGDAAIMVDIDFERQSTPPENDPAAIYAQAALRMLAIAQALDVSVAGVSTTMRAIGAFAGQLIYDWKMPPR